MAILGWITNFLVSDCLPMCLYKRLDLFDVLNKKFYIHNAERKEILIKNLLKR